MGGCCRYGGRYQQLQHFSILFPQAIMCWCSQCCFDVSTLLGLSLLPPVSFGEAVSAALTGLLIPHSSFLRSCLPVSLLSGLRFCVLLPWACLSLVPDLVSQLVTQRVWDAVSASLVLSCYCLQACLLSGLRCCVRLSHLSFVL